MRRYSPKIDLVFRKLFGSAENKDLLLSLINAVTDNNPALTDLTILNPYNLATYVGDKTSILDIKAVDAAGTHYDVELQIGAHGMYGKRALYYLSKMYVDQLAEGEPYSTLNTTIGIHLLDFSYFQDNRYRRHFVYKDNETNERPEHLSYHQLYFIEMSKFRKDWDDISALLDRWIAFLNNAPGLIADAVPPPLQAEPAIVKALAKLDVLGLDSQEQEIYEGEMKAWRDREEEVRTAVEKGKAEGRIEGKEEGISEGFRLALERLTVAGMPEDEARALLGLA